MRKITDNVFFVGGEDWDRRLFDSLIPLPDGTSYNSYLIKGSEKTALIDTVDPRLADTLLNYLKDVEKVDYVISNHAEQDHSGSLPVILERYKNAKLVTNPKCKEMLIDHLHISEDRFLTVNDGETLDLGHKKLEFIYTPWVHWPETMCTYLTQDKILFSCDFFGSHMAGTDLFVSDEGSIYEAAKRYYAEIMMPFRATIKKNIEKIEKKDVEMIAPSHGPIYNKPKFIVDAYKDWISDQPKNSVVVPFITMHDSTRKLVDHLMIRLAEEGINGHRFDLTNTDLGKLAITLVDAATLIIATPTVHAGPHPSVFYAAHLANALRPKLKFAGLIISYGWSSKAAEQIGALIPNLRVSIFDPIICKGLPRKEDIQAVNRLVGQIKEKHHSLGLI